MDVMIGHGRGADPAFEFEAVAPMADFVDVELVPRQVLHGSQDDARLTHRVALGRPMVVPLQPDRVADEVLRGYVRQHFADSTFCLVVLAVNFYPLPSEPVEHAGVGVRLQHDGPEGLIAPVARSISPVRLADRVTDRTTIAVTANLGIVEPKVEAGVEGHREDAFLIGVGEGRSEPAWSFKRTDRHELVGVYVLSLVAEMPIGPRSEALLAVSASVRRKFAKVIHYRGELPRDLSVVPLTQRYCG